MEPEWAAVELLDCIEEELTPRREVEQQQHERSSQMMLDAIRVLPAPEAGDLFVTCAARGHVGVVLFYFEEGTVVQCPYTADVSCFSLVAMSSVFSTVPQRHGDEHTSIKWLINHRSTFLGGR